MPLLRSPACPSTTPLSFDRGRRPACSDGPRDQHSRQRCLTGLDAPLSTNVASLTIGSRRYMFLLKSRLVGWRPSLVGLGLLLGGHPFLISSFALIPKTCRGSLYMKTSNPSVCEAASRITRWLEPSAYLSFLKNQTGLQPKSDGLEPTSNGFHKCFFQKEEPDWPWQRLFCFILCHWKERLASELDRKMRLAGEVADGISTKNSVFTVVRVQNRSRE